MGAQPEIASLGPQVGAHMPEFSGVDQFGKRHTLESVLGPEGAMVVFYRSADW
jgi:peroxiredoxin